MLMRRDYRDRAIGLVAAIAVLITGSLVTGSLVAAPAPLSAVVAPDRCDVVC